MSFYMHQRRDNVKWVIAFVLIAVLLVGMVITFVKLADNETTNTVRASAFEIGGLSAEGKEIKDTGCIRMKKAVNVDGLAIKLVEEATVSYKVYYFSVDEDGKEVFISASEALSADLDASSIPDTAEVCKIVIEPTLDAEVSLFEINGYANQLTITYNK